MNVRTITRSRLSTVAVALVAATAAAPAALADPPQDHRATTTVVRPDDRAVRGVPVQAGHVAVRPDDRAVRGIPSSLERIPVRPDDRAIRFSAPSPGSEPVLVSTPRSSFDWGDGGLGLVLGFGLALVLGAATLATRSRLAHA